MKNKLTIVIALFALLACAATPAVAHRLDEYLQATTVSLETRRVALHMRLTPGIAVADKVLAQIDCDGNGTISESEQRAYAQAVFHDCSLAIDGRPADLRLVSCAFPAIDQLKAGMGDIVLEFEADLPPDGASVRRLSFDNHHQKPIGVYLVNCLVPRDPGIHIGTQNRNYDQSSYQLDFSFEDAAINALAAGESPSRLRRWLDQTGHLAILKSYFVHGVHHILTGYDHLLFVSALVLAAATLWDLVKVVTAFTLAHSITLTLAALNLVHLPERVVEPLIAASIVFVAMQNIFWPGLARGRSRLAAAFLFGLFHGLGFAGGLLDLMHQMNGTTVLLALLGFSLGVEAGHQVVLLPLFACLKAVRHTQPDAVLRTRLAMLLQRFGSAGISIAGTYYLCVALLGIWR